MFDYLRCKYPLPVEGANELQFQTKDAQSNPWMDQFEIREDGSLWHEEYDIEDRSDKTAPEGSLKRLQGSMTRVNERWVPHELTGEVCFSHWNGARSITFSAYFLGGKLRELHDITPDAS